MAIALGPQTDTLLHSLTEELKGKTQLTEPYVDKKTIIRAVREQNAILQTLQSQFVSSVHRMNEMQSTLSKQNAVVETLQNKVRDLEAVAEKVSVIEDTLEDWRGKIALVDHLVEEVSNHSEQMMEIRRDVSQNERAVNELRTSVDDNFEEVNRRATTLTNDVRDLPNTIQISSHQVRMSRATSSNDDETLTNAMMMQNGRCNLLEEGVSSLSAIVETQHAPIVSLVETTIAPETTKLRTDVDALTTWKEEQSNVDLMELRKGHDALELGVESLQNDMSERVVDREEMQSKLDETFETIIDHLQTALVSTEKDEADFKAVTDNLNRMYEALREEKADKADIAKLRGQFIENHVESVAPSSGGSGLTNEQMRRLLVNYVTMDELQRLLNAKADADACHSRFDRTNRVLRGMSKIVDELAVAKLGVDGTALTAMDVSSTHDDDATAMAPTTTTTNDGHTEKGFMLTQPLDSIDETNEESNIIPDNENATTSEVSSSSSSSLVGKNNNNNKTPSEQHLIVQLPQLATRLSPRRQRRLSAGDVDDFNDFINVRPAAPNEQRQPQQQQQRLFVRRSRSQTDLPDNDDNNKEPSILPPPLAVASGNRLRVDRIYPSREKTTGSSSFVPSSKYNNNNGSSTDGRNVKVTSQTIEFPIINKDRMRYNPGISYGGGYQLVPPTAAAANNDKKKMKGSSAAAAAPPLRALDQYKTVLPVVEKKTMVVGVDGKFYVSARVGNNGGTTMATATGGSHGGSGGVMTTTTTPTAASTTTNATSEVTGRMDHSKRDEALSNVGNTKII